MHHQPLIIIYRPIIEINYPVEYFSCCKLSACMWGVILPLSLHRLSYFSGFLLGFSPVLYPPGVSRFPATYFLGVISLAKCSSHNCRFYVQIIAWWREPSPLWGERWESGVNPHHYEVRGERWESGVNPHHYEVRGERVAWILTIMRWEVREWRESSPLWGERVAWTLTIMRWEVRGERVAWILTIMRWEVRGWRESSPLWGERWEGGVNPRHYEVRGERVAWILTIMRREVRGERWEVRGERWESGVNHHHYEVREWRVRDTDPESVVRRLDIMDPSNRATIHEIDWCEQ